VTYHVVIVFDRDAEGDLKPSEAREVLSPIVAERRARALSLEHAGAVAFSRTGDPITSTFEPIAWAHLSAENAPRSHGDHERVHAGSITVENSNPERLDHGDSRFFLVSFSNAQAGDAYLP
jgi:hypothetical protein